MDNPLSPKRNNIAIQHGNASGLGPSSLPKEDLDLAFTIEDDRAVMWRVDRRFLPLIAMMVLVKNVSIDALYTALAD